MTDLFNTLSGIKSWEAAHKIMDDIVHNDNKFIHDKFRSTSKKIGTLGLTHYKDVFVNPYDKKIALVLSDDQYIQSQWFGGVNNICFLISRAKKF